MKKLWKVILACMMMIMIIPVRVNAQTTKGDVVVRWESIQDSLNRAEKAEMTEEEKNKLKNSVNFSPLMTADVGDNVFQESEPNDYEEISNLLENDYTVYGELSDVDLLDFYEFTLSVESEVIIVSAAELETVEFCILDAEGNFIVASEDWGYNDGYYEDVIYWPLDAGTYYLVMLDSNESTLSYVFYYDSQPHTHTWDSGIISAEADCITPGKKIYTCTLCDQTRVEDIPATGHTPVNGYCTVCGKLGFNDVMEGAYYYDAVEWAVNNGITNGYGSDTIFNPDGTCTRGQVVTFLWRANGSPEPASMNNPFTDVKSSDYYYKAVLWAVENEITNGYGSDTIFNPDGACTRGQVATFLWRAEGKPDMSHAENPFADVKAGEFYYDAVLWAVENGITNGYGSDTIFYPDGDCTRGQIVTFLYRAMN